jgi:hypothetical protein
LSEIGSLNAESAVGFDMLLRSLRIERNELARLLCEVWLRQALRGRNFPVDASPHNIVVLPDKQIAFTGGPFAVLAAESQTNLWNYLLAAANENSDKACFCLLKEMRRERVTERNKLRQRFRQAMPFRDGGWDADSDSQSLAELLFVQWRFADQSGYAPLLHLPAFYRGLFSVADTARRIALDGDSFAEGLRDLRLIGGLEAFGRMMNERSVADQLDKYSAMMLDLPQNMDEALTWMSKSRQLGLPAEHSSEHRGESSTVIVVALLLLLGSGVLLVHIAAPLVTTWSNRINTIVFIVFGALLLRAVSRR